MKICMILKRSFEQLKKDSRVIKEAKTLIREGHEVSVVIFGDDNSNSYEKLYDIDVKIVKITNINIFKKFNLFGVQTYVCSNKNILCFLIKKLAIQFYELHYFFNTLRKLDNENVDVFHAHDFETLILGYISASRKKTKIIYDSHELWTESRSFTKLSGKIKKPFIVIIESFLLKKIDAIITVNDSIAGYLARKYKIQKPIVVSNFPEHSNMRGNDILRRKLSTDKTKRIVLYQGSIFKGRGLENLIECCKYLENIELVIMGDGYFRASIEKIIQKENLNQVRIIDAVPLDILMNYTSSADIGIAPIQNICLSYYYSLPNKIGEFIMAGIPFAVSDFPEMRRLALKENMGVVFDPENINSMVMALNTLLDPEIYELKRQNVLRAKEKYTWEKECVKLIKVYDELENKI